MLKSTKTQKKLTTIVTPLDMINKIQVLESVYIPQVLDRELAPTVFDKKQGDLSYSIVPHGKCTSHT